MRTVRGLGLWVACPLPVRGQGLDINTDIRTGHGADIPRPFRDRFADAKSFAGEGVGLALGLNMMGNGLLPLLKNFFPPVFQLHGDGFYAADLFNGS